MPKSHLTIWCNTNEVIPVLDLLRQETQDHHLILSDSSAKEPDDRLCNADIAFGQPQPAAIRTCRQIKWVQLSSAGHSRYDSDALREALAGRGAILTNSSSVTAGPCAEHLAAMMLALSRHLPLLWLNQQAERAWKPARPEGITILEGQTALIVGYGAIGRRLTELLAPYRMNLIGIRRVPSVMVLHD